MAASKTSFQPGKSGNPKGRPPKPRALTNLMEKWGNKASPVEGLKYKELLMMRIWQAATLGQIDYGDGRIEKVSPKEAALFAGLLMRQVDGPPPAQVDVTSMGEKISAIAIVEVNHPADTEDE
jgi:hypothetical protein